MQGGNRILDDFARIMTDAAGMAQGVRREAEGVFKAQFERMIRDMALVTREEFEAVREMAQLARPHHKSFIIRQCLLNYALLIRRPAIKRVWTLRIGHCANNANP